MATSIDALLVGYGAFNTSSGYSSGLANIDLSGLFPSTSAQAANIPIRKPSTFVAPSVDAPVADKRTLATRIADVRNQASFIQENGTSSAIASNKDLKTSFTLFKALDDLRTISQYASEKNTSATELASLNTQFQKGLKQIESYIGTAATNQLHFLFADKPTHEKSNVVSHPLASNAYTGIGIATTSATTLTGIDPAAKFTVSLAKNTIVNGITTTAAADTATVDLSTITTPLTLDKVVSAINTAIAAVPQLSSAGDVLNGADGKPLPKYIERAYVSTDSNGKKAISFTGSSSESVSLASGTAVPGAYLLNQITGTDSKTNGQLVRVDNLTGTATSSIITDNIAGIDTAATGLAQASFAANPPKTNALLGKLAPEPTPPGNVLNTATVSATAVDSKGFVYVVGTASGKVGDEIGTTANDLFLTKYDSNGKALFSRVLGAGGTAQGAAISIDASDNVVVAGTTSGKSATNDIFSGNDSYVSKFSSDGKELFTTQLDSFAKDGATAVTTDAAGNIYLAGTVSGTFRGQTSQGGQDSYLVKIDGKTGKTTATTQFGSSGSDAPSAIATLADGSVVVGGTENGNATVRKFNGADITTASTVSSLGSGTLTQLSVDKISGTVVVAGTVAGDLAGFPGAHGNNDGFVAKLDAALGAQSVAYVGGINSDSISGLAINGGKVYVSGTTNDVLGTAKTGISDAYLARLDFATLAQEQVTQTGTAKLATTGNALAITDSGPGVLAQLGLRSGSLANTQTTDLISQTSLRVGDSFSFKIDGGLSHQITISANETFKTLAQKINLAGYGKIKATASDLTSGGSIDIRQQGESTIDLIPGKDGSDVLHKLGIAPAKLLPTDVLFSLNTQTGAHAKDQVPGGTFNLGLTENLKVDTKQNAAFVKTQIDTAIATIQRSQRSLYFDENLARAALQKSTAGSAPAYLQAQTYGYQVALQRLQSLNSGGSSSDLTSLF